MRVKFSTLDLSLFLRMFPTLDLSLVHRIKFPTLNLSLALRITLNLLLVLHKTRFLH